jgi:hypothetical protein
VSDSSETYPREAPPPPDAASSIWCRECGRGYWSEALQTGPDSFHGLTMYRQRFDRRTGRDTGICELCFDGETLHYLARRRAREDGLT